MPQPMEPSKESPSQISYSFKPALTGAAQQFELTDAGLKWRAGRRHGLWPYGSIAAIRLSYRPSTMQSRRFQAGIANREGQRLTILSTSWQTVALMTPQDAGYRAFVRELHRRVAGAGGTVTLQGGLTPAVYALGLTFLALVATALAGLLLRAIAIGALAGALFLVGFAVLFGWQIGGFLRRNRPRAYTFENLPPNLVP